MPDIDEFLVGDGGLKPPGSRHDVDDFLLSFPVSTTPARTQVLPKAGEPQPNAARELLNPDSIMPDPLQAGMITMGETASDALTRVSDPRVQELINESRPGTASLREEFPLATTLGDVGATMAVPGGGVIGGAAAGALISDDPLSGAVFGAAGGVLGALGSRVLMRGVTPFPRRVGGGATSEVKRLAKKLGVKLELADLTGNKSLKNAGSAIRRNPMASAPFDKVDDFNIRQFNRAALKSIGARGDNITDDVLESTRKQLSNGFENIGKRVKRVRVTPEFQRDLNGLLDEARLSLDANAFSVFERNVNEVMDTIANNPDGRALTSLSSALGKRAHKLTKPGSVATGAGDDLYDLKELVDDLFIDNAPPGSKAELTELRRKWGNLRLLRDRNVVVAGDINPGALRAKIQTKDPDAFRLGGKQDNPLFDIARLHERVRELIPNSGTPTGQAFEPGNLLTSLPQKAAAELLNDPVFKFLARNNLIPTAAQETLSRAASRAGTVQTVDALGL